MTHLHQVHTLKITQILDYYIRYIFGMHFVSWIKCIPHKVIFGDSNKVLPERGFRKRPGDVMKIWNDLVVLYKMSRWIVLHDSKVRQNKFDFRKSGIHCQCLSYLSWIINHKTYLHPKGGHFVIKTHFEMVNPWFCCGNKH